MKTERIEFVAPPGLKARLQEEASRNNISVGELIRRRFEPTGDEMELVKLTEELKKATTEARSDLARAMGEVSGLVDELRSRRLEVERVISRGGQSRLWGQESVPPWDKGKRSTDRQLKILGCYRP